MTDTLIVVMLKRWTARGLHTLRTQHKRVVVLVIAAFMLVSSVAALGGAPVQADSLSDASSLGASNGLGVTTCAIETVGWVICPVMRTIAKLADYGFSFVNENYLKIDYTISNTDSGIYTAWSLMLAIANVTLVLAFLYIIYTQITGRNAGGYNIKRLLPRLIVGAILVNISYYICAAAIQLSNVIGASMLQIMEGVTQKIGTPAMSLHNAANGFKDGVLSDLTSAMLTKTGTIWILMAPIAAVIISIAIVAAASIILLIARKVIVAMLVLVSPLLFVTYLLPNIEHYFQQWLRLFIQLLLVFPVVAFLLGTGQIISATIINVGSSGDTNYAVKDDGYQAKSGGSGSATTDLAACAAAVLPLIGVWFLMKGLSSVMTSGASKLAANVGRGSRAKERAEKMQAKLGKPGLTPGGIPGTGFDRKPAFSRLAGRRHKASLGGSNAPQPPNQPGRTAQPPQTLASSLDNLMKKDGGQQQAQQAQQQAAEAAKMAGEINGGNVTAGMEGSVQATLKKDDKKEGKTAKDIFNNMNKGHQAKDQQRSFSSGPAPAGGGGSGSGGGGGGEAGHANDYRAPSMAQPMSAPTQSSSHSSGGPVSIVTVPVQVDASALLQPSMNAGGQHQPPSSIMTDKAKARAQKYLFDSATGVESAADRLEELGKKLEDEQQGDDKKQGE